MQSPFSIVAYVAMALIIVLALWLKRRRARFEAALPAADTMAIAAIDEEIESHEPHPQPDRGRLSTTALPKVERPRPDRREGDDRD